MGILEIWRKKLANVPRSLIGKTSLHIIEKSNMFKNKQLFCSKPFKWFEVFRWNQTAEVYLCCAGWLDTSIGRLQYQTIEEIWNGEKAQEIRRSILDGSFKYCNRSLCPYLQTATGPV